MNNLCFRLKIVSLFIAYSLCVQAQEEMLGLWVVHIETVNKEVPTCQISEAPSGCAGLGIKNANKVPGRVWITDTGGGILYDSGNYQEGKSGMTIKVRGNTSAAKYHKKPYKIKLQSKADMLVRGDKYADKDWLLIKNWGLNGFIGMTVNELMDMQWTPQFRYVNVVFNGEYAGLYMLCESVKRNKDCRLNVSKTGYVFEYDAYWWNEDVYVESTFISAPMHYTIKYPDSKDITKEQLTYLQDVVTTAEMSVDTKEYEKYIDISSFVRWLVGHDILGTADGAGSNFFLTKYDDTNDSKIMMANLWDFDAILNGLHGDSRSEVFTDGHVMFFYKQLFNDSQFVSQYIDNYKYYSDFVFDRMTKAIIDFRDSEYGRAYIQSWYKDWDFWSYDYQAVEDMTIEQRFQIAIEWFSTRKDILDRAVEALINSTAQIEVPLQFSETKECYDLLGRKFPFVRKGIYIDNGRKVLFSPIN